MADIENAKRCFFEAVALLDRGDFANGVLRLRQALDFAPDNVSILTNLAGALMMQGGFAEARAAAERVLAQEAGNLGALLVVAECLTREGRDAEAVATLDTVIAREPQVAEHHSNRAAALNRLKRHDEALASAERAIALKPNLAAASLNRGNGLFGLQRHHEALASYDRALGFDADAAEALTGRGNALAALQRYGEAIAAFDAVLRRNANAAHAWLGRGNALAGGKRFDEALAAFAQALTADPALADAWLGRGNTLKDLAHYGEALEAYDRALALGGDAAAWAGRGNVLSELWRDDEALAAFDRALAADPALPEAWFGRACALDNLKRHEEAIAAFDRALELAPETRFASGSRLQAKALLCDWADWDAACAAVITDVCRGAAVVTPFDLIAMTSSATAQLQCARTFVAERFSAAPPAPLTFPPRSRNRQDRIHIAYLSADFRAHPVSVLTAGLFECHDRARFRTTAISFGPGSDDPLRTRIKGAFEQFVDIENMSDSEATVLLRERGIDIAVDLMGYTRGFRTGILARRAAPVQVNYLGFPATMGADFIDYIIADRHVIPEDARSAYAESVVSLPDSFQANDRKRLRPDNIPRRRDLGLPETGLVFCAFNNLTKVSPAVFDVWMRLLRQVDSAVLWMLASNAATERNLCGAAASCGVASERLIFARRVPYADYLARYQCADLFLDTWPFNGGTTTSDALWAGLPVITAAGEAFAARMTTSLLHAAGLPELATGSPGEYEALVLMLARDPDKLAAVKARLAANRTTCALFDTARFCRHLEAAFTTMYERHRRGEPPASFAVAAIGPDGGLERDPFR